MSPIARRIAYLVLGMLGILVGTAGSMIQDGWFPGGLILALAGTGGLFVGGTALTHTRLGAGIPTAAWFITVMYLSISRPEGDFLFAAGVGPYVYLLGGMALGVASTTWSRPMALAPH